MEVVEEQIFKAIIRVVKTLHDDWHGSYFGKIEVARKPLIYAKDKTEVKQILLKKYPHFFQNNKIYERKTKDETQFFYVVIHPLYNYEKELVEKSEWECSYCKQKYENQYVDKPLRNERRFGEDVLFCNDGEKYCLNEFTRNTSLDNDNFLDDDYYIKIDSPVYIYKITEKASGKCYIGKTKNEPFFRWWNHLAYSTSPFGLYLQNSKLDSWQFEVLEVLPSTV